MEKDNVKREIPYNTNECIMKLVDEVHEMNRLAYAALVITGEATGLSAEEAKSNIDLALAEYDSKQHMIEE